MIQKYVTLFLIICLCVPTVVAAQGASDFTVSVFGGLDAIAPTTPVIVRIDPVASSQITLAWSTSTDNVSLAGYVVFRDDSAIATTTDQVFSDVGLVASTTYSYTIKSFDSAFNYSTTSTPAATTTLGIVTPPVVVTQTPVPTAGTIIPARNSLIEVSSGDTDASILISNGQFMRLEIRYGTSSSFGTASIATENFVREHEFLLQGLQSQTKYYYQILGQTANGRSYILAEDSFKTEETFDFTVPNVGQLKLVQQKDDVLLEYIIPTDQVQRGPFAVRVVRNHFWYPKSATDGIIVYQGLSTGVRDIDAFKYGAPVYYTVFLIDRTGRVSSGAAAVIFDTRTTSAFIESQTSVDDDSVSSSSEQTRYVFEIEKMFVEQRSGEQIPLSALDELYAKEGFVIAIPADQISWQAELITLRFGNNTADANNYTYIARKQADDVWYSANIPALHLRGNQPLEIEAYDSTGGLLQSVKIDLAFTDEAPMRETESDDQSLWLMAGIVGSIIGVLIGLLSMLIRRSWR